VDGEGVALDRCARREGDMFPTFCGVAGPAGWALMLLVWLGLVALTVWAIARLFPDRSARAEPAVREPQQPAAAAPSSLIESGQH
jgi:hypothetical protein